jgi:hypothetical protein
MFNFSLPKFNVSIAHDKAPVPSNKNQSVRHTSYVAASATREEKPAHEM